MHLYLTRHGETRHNALGKYCGSTDIPLNETGFRQAHDLAQRMKEIKLDVVVSSPMIKARQTAEIVCAAQNLQCVIYDQFVERNMGVYEGFTRDEAKHKYPGIWCKLSTRSPDEAPDGGETIREVCSRVDDGMTRLIHTNSKLTL